MMEAQVSIKFTMDREDLESVLWLADSYTPQAWYRYDKPKGKSWVDEVLDGETVKFVDIDQIDTNNQLWGGPFGPPPLDDDGHVKLMPHTEIHDLNLEVLQKGFVKWVRWYYDTFNRLPEAEDCDVDSGDALLQFSLLGEIIYG